MAAQHTSKKLGGATIRLRGKTGAKHLATARRHLLQMSTATECISRQIARGCERVMAEAAEDEEQEADM